MELKEYLIRDYELKAGFLTEHFGRMWTRFNFFVAAETAIVGGSVIFNASAEPAVALLWLGFSVSVIWYVMGAEDKYLADLYRGELRETFHQLIKENGLYQDPSAPLYHVGQVKDTDLVKLSVKKWFTSWRVDAISTTHLAAWIPLLATVCWAGWLVRELVVKVD